MEHPPSSQRTTFGTSPTPRSVRLRTSGSEPTYDDMFPDDHDRHDGAVVLDMRIRHLGRSRTPRKKQLIQWREEACEQPHWVKEQGAVGTEEDIVEFEERRRAHISPQ